MNDVFFTNMTKFDHQKNNFTTLVAPKSNERLSLIDNIFVSLSSLIFVGGIAWLPALYIWLYKKWKNTPDDKENDKKRRKLYRNIVIVSILLGIWAPHRRKKFGDLINFRNWKMVKAWVNYMAFEVISEFSPTNNSGSSRSSRDRDNANFDMKKDQAIFAIVPHGIVPISLGFATLPPLDLHFGGFRPVVASATKFLPFFRSVLSWIDSIDANKSSVDLALSNGDRIGLSPGGIGEMFEGYPKPGRLPNDECALLKSRKGFVKLALKHRVPLIPVYCFGATKMFKRLQVPMIERLSNFLRVSLVIFFGRYGLPIPFQQRLLWVIGKPIHPPIIDSSIVNEDSMEFQEMVDKLHAKFCDELKGIFDRHKHYYGWAHKTLRIV